MARAPGYGAAFRKLVGLRLKVGHMNGSTLQHGAPPDAASHDRDAEAGDVANGPVVGVLSKGIAVESEEGCVLRSTEASGALDDGVQDRRQVRRRGADYAEDFGRRRLLLEGLAQGVPQPFDLALQLVDLVLEIIYVRFRTRSAPVHGRTTFETEL